MLCFCLFCFVLFVVNSGQEPNVTRCVSIYGLGSGCHAEPRVGESIGSKHKDRNKLVKVEGR